MIIKKPPMGWNTWNTFGKNINEQMVMEMADAICEKGYKDAGYEYIIIDDMWHLPERVDGKQVPNPELFPHGMKYVADYVHSKGLKFGMYSCAGVMTCGKLPGSYGFEYVDAKQYADWGVDYLKYDFCYFPKSAKAEMAYTKMSMALRNCGRDILFAACNWGEQEPHLWMRSRGVHSYRSTCDIADNTESFASIFESQLEKISLSGGGFYNDMDMLTVGMRNNGLVALGGCSDKEYQLQFAAWAFMGSPLIMGGDIRNMSDFDRDILQNKHLIAINQDSEALPPYLIGRDGASPRQFALARMLSGGRIALGLFNISEKTWWQSGVVFEDIGIPADSGIKLRLTDAVTCEEIGVFENCYESQLESMEFKVLIGEIVK